MCDTQTKHTHRAEKEERNAQANVVSGKCTIQTVWTTENPEDKTTGRDNQARIFNGDQIHTVLKQ